MPTRQKTIRLVVLILIVAGILAVSSAMVILPYSHKRPIVLAGAVISQDPNPANETPIDDVEVSAADNLAATTVKSNFNGFFAIPLRPGVSRNQSVTLQFRRPDYQPVDLTQLASDNLSVVRMVPLQKGAATPAVRTPIPVTNVLIRYSTVATDQENIGAGVKTFEVPNVGNVPCKNQPPCSPDGKWKASVVSQSLDAGEGSVFRDARVSCLAGPCPFTRIDNDGFSRGGRVISVTVRNWSDTTTFLIQAEVYRVQINNIVRMEYPIILESSLNFTLPPSADGPTVEAEVNGENIVFPLGPNPILSWANCNVIIDRNQSKIYRCELKNGYEFRQQQ
jgi:hypothetical protein